MIPWSLKHGPAAEPGVLAIGSLGWWMSNAELDLDFTSDRSYNRKTGFNGSPNGLLTYTSPSPKLIYGSDGVLGYAPHNLLTYSEQFDNAIWLTGGLNSAVNSNVTSAPNGTTMADRLIDNVAGGSSTVGIAYAVTVSTTTAYTFSVYLKADQLSLAHLRCVSLTTPADGGVWFDLSAGTILTQNSGYTGSIQSVGGGWYRCAITFTTDAADTAGQLRIYPAETDNVATVTRDGTSSIFMWGAQLSRGSTLFDYIPTTSAAVYHLPIDHDPVTYGPLGVLIEEQRTNLLLQSQTFETTWNTQRCSISSNVALGGDGTQTADAFVEDSASGSHQLYQSITKAASSIQYALSVEIEPETRTWCRLIANTGGEANFAHAFFDLTGNGAVGSTGTGGSGFTYHSATIAVLPNGRYKLTLVFTSDAGTSLSLGIKSADINGSTGHVGNSLTAFYLWGAQLEAGAFATSYIPTVASQVTRAADKVTIAQSGYAFNVNAGTFAVEYDLIGYVANYRIVSGGGAYRYFYGPTNVTTLASYNGSAAVTTTVVSPVNSPIKSAMSYDGSGRSITDNGDAISGLMTDANAFPTLSNTTGIGADPDGASPLNGHIKRLTYWNTRKSNSELQALSA